MKKILLGSVATGALVAAGSASAADLGPRPAYKAPPMVAPVPVFSWTGCFVGAHGGWGWGKKDVTEVARSGPPTDSSVGTLGAGIDTSGGIFGGQIGCDYQFAGNFVIGIQGDFAGARITGDTAGLPLRPHSFTSTVFQSTSEAAHTHVRTDWLASITGRLGFTGWLPRTLFYVRGGGAWIREKWDFQMAEDFNDNPEFSSTQTRSGWTVGGGIEYAIAPNWSVFAEFNHYDFGTKSVGHQSGSSSFGAFINIDAKQRIEAVRLGVNYRFNWGKGKAPVVAKY
jgi:outer membrane immunogenic protein